MQVAVAALHAGYWLLYGLLLWLLLLVGRLPDRIGWTVAAQLMASPLVVLAVVPNVAAFYTSYLTLLPRFGVRARLGPLILAAVIVCVATSALGLALLYLLYGTGQPVFRSASEVAGLGLLLALLAAVHVVIALVMRGFVDYVRDRSVREMLVRKTHAMELALVRSHLDPHFLFNTLNNLDVLIARDPAVASAYLTRLSEIMRFVLYEAKGDLIPLTSELEYLERYFALERLRWRRADFARHDVTGRAAGLWIAPMTLIPFVENAFKHSEGRKEDGQVVSRVAIDGRRITFECVNHFRAAAPPTTDAGGIGTALIRQRLHLLYPQRHQLDAGAEGDVYRVRLTLETTDDPLHHR